MNLKHSRDASAGGGVGSRGLLLMRLNKLSGCWRRMPVARPWLLIALNWGALFLLDIHRLARPWWRAVRHPGIPASRGKGGIQAWILTLRRYQPGDVANASRRVKRTSRLV